VRWFRPVLCFLPPFFHGKAPNCSMGISFRELANNVSNLKGYGTKGSNTQRPICLSGGVWSQSDRKNNSNGISVDNSLMNSMLSGGIGENRANLIGAMALFLAALVFFLHLSAPGLTADDSGEFTVCSLLLGNGHAPGYPLHYLLGRLALLIPLGAPAFRLTLLSAGAGALAVWGVWALSRETARICGFTGRSLALTGLISALGFGFLPSALEQVTRPEKYSLFIALFVWSLVYLARWHRLKEKTPPWKFFLLCGLSASSHYLAGVLLVPLAFAVIQRRQVRTILLAVFLCLLPFSLRLLYPPIRSAGSSRLDVGLPQTISALTRYLGVASYADRFDHSSVAGGRMARIKEHSRSLVREAGPLLGAGIPGGVLLFASSPVMAGIGAGIAAVTVALVETRTDLPLVYNQPVIILFCVLAGLSCGWLAKRSWVGIVAGILLLGSMGARLPTGLNASRDYTVPDLSRAMASELPHGAVVVAHDDGWLFPLWHILAVDEVRTDLAVVTALFESPAGLGPCGWREPIEKESHRYGSGVAILWSLARHFPAGVFADPLEVPLPSTGWIRHGLFVRITRPGKAGLPEKGARFSWRDWQGPGMTRENALRERVERVRAGRILEELVGRTAAELVEQGMRHLNGMKPASAARSFDSALKLDRDCVAAWNGRGLLAFMEERFSDALVAYREAIRLSPGDSQAQEGVVNAALARAASTRISGLESRMERNPHDFVLLCDLGSAYFRIGRYRSAERLIRLALDIKPGYARGWDNLGSLQASQGEARGALRSYVRAVSCDSGFSSAMVNAATVCLWLGERKSARSWLERARQAGSRDPRLPGLLKAL